MGKHSGMIARQLVGVISITLPLAIGFLPPAQTAEGSAETILVGEYKDQLEELQKRSVELYTSGRYAEAVAVATEALSYAEQHRPPDHEDVAASLTTLALLNAIEKRYAEAEPLLVRALAIRERILAPDDPHLAEGVKNLAALYHDQGRLAQAESLYHRALDLRQHSLPTDHPDLATDLTTLALVLRQQDQLAGASFPIARPWQRR